MTPVSCRAKCDKQNTSIKFLLSVSAKCLANYDFF